MDPSIEELYIMLLVDDWTVHDQSSNKEGYITITCIPPDDPESYHEILFNAYHTVLEPCEYYNQIYNHKPTNPRIHKSTDP